MARGTPNTARAADRSAYTAEPLVHTLDEILTKMPGLSRSKLFAELASGRLASFKIGRRRYVRPRDLEEWIESYVAEQPPLTAVIDPRRKKAPQLTEATTKTTTRRRRGPNRKNTKGRRGDAPAQEAGDANRCKGQRTPARRQPTGHRHSSRCSEQGRSSAPQERQGVHRALPSAR